MIAAVSGLSESRTSCMWNGVPMTQTISAA
jgi:hypothetical protein